MFGSLTYKRSPPNVLKYSPTNAVLARSPPTAFLCIMQSIPNPHVSIFTESRLGMFLPCSNNGNSVIPLTLKNMTLLLLFVYIAQPRCLTSRFTFQEASPLLVTSRLVFLVIDSPAVGAIMYSSFSRSDSCSSYGQNTLDLILHCQNKLFSIAQIFTLVRPLIIRHAVSYENYLGVENCSQCRRPLRCDERNRNHLLTAHDIKEQHARILTAGERRLTGHPGSRFSLTDADVARMPGTRSVLRRPAHSFRANFTRTCSCHFSRLSFTANRAAAQ